MLNESNDVLVEAEFISRWLFPELDASEGVGLYLNAIFRTDAAMIGGISNSTLYVSNSRVLLDLGLSRTEFRQLFHDRLYKALESGVTPSGQGFSASPRVDNPNDD